MKLMFYFFLFLSFQSCGQLHNTNAESNGTASIDTNFIKKSKWKTLNEFISFSIVKSGVITNDSSIHFKLTPIAWYSYATKVYSINSDSSINLNLREVRTLLACDTISARKEMDYLFKVNSEIAYRDKPELLETIFIRPLNSNEKEIDLLIRNLKKEKFIKSVVKNGIDSLINIKIDADYSNLKGINKIIPKLRSTQNVSEVFFTDFFTGQNKQDLFYRITSE